MISPGKKLKEELVMKTLLVGNLRLFVFVSKKQFFCDCHWWPNAHTILIAWLVYSSIPTPTGTIYPLFRSIDESPCTAGATR